MPAVKRRRAVLDRLWAVVEHCTVRIEASLAARSQAALSRDIALLVRTVETLAKVVQNWPPEPPAGAPQRSLEEVRADFARRLLEHCRTIHPEIFRGSEEGPAAQGDPPAETSSGAPQAQGSLPVPCQ